MRNSLTFLGLARKAGAVEAGEEPAVAAVRDGKARIIACACDAAENARKKAEDAASFRNVPFAVLPVTKDELGGALGLGRPAAIAVTDINFASGFISKLNAEEDGQFGELEELLRKKAASAAERKRVKGRPGKDIKKNGRR